jgi:hypothetical protein
MTPTQLSLSFSLIHSDKSKRDAFVTDILRGIDCGEVNPLDAHLFLKSLEEVVKKIYASDWYKNQVLSEAQKYNSKSFEYRNAKVEIKEMGGNYNYEGCHDPELVELLRQEKEIKAKIKAKEDFLKSLPAQGLQTLDGETGEIYMMYPPVKEGSKTTTVITLK